MRRLFLTMITPLALLLIVGSAISGSSAAYSDTESLPANQQEAIQNLTNKGLVEGYSDSTYRPSQHVNRAEYLKVLVSASGREFPMLDHNVCFKDFRGTEEQWYWVYACSAKSAGIIDGYPDGTFRGDKFINIAEAAKIATYAFELPEPMFFRAPNNWYDPFMIVMEGEGVFEGVRKEPGAYMTRAEMAFLIMKLSGRSQPQCDGHALGESYKVDCNTCTCTENGSACTKMACPVKTKCFSSNDCSWGQTCSTERGDCQSACEPSAEMCPAVCAGVCE